MIVHIALKEVLFFIVYFLDCQGTSFLLLVKQLIKKRLWQFDGSWSDGHPWLYPTCQGGMNCPSHQRSPLIILVEIVEKGTSRRLRSIKYCYNRKEIVALPVNLNLWICSLFRVISHVEFMWYGLKLFYEILTWQAYNWTLLTRYPYDWLNL